MNAATERRPLILVTNDDGWDALGMRVLVEALTAWAEVIVVAPKTEQSGAAHSLTLTSPLRIERVQPQRYRVDGTPTDCVHLAVFRFGQAGRPDLVISGINHGLNIGDDVTYSGTVAGALEGTLLHIPALAVSVETGDKPVEIPTFSQAAGMACLLARQVLEHGLPEGVLLNLNVPTRCDGDIRVTRQGSRRYRAAMVARADPSGREYYWTAPPDYTPHCEQDSDYQAIGECSASLTPLTVDMTADSFRTKLAAWDLPRGKNR